jgi:signal transduction histidine kinase
MHKRGFIILLSVFLFFSQYSYSQKNVKNVVIFFSLGSNLTSYQKVLEGFKSTFNQKSDEPGNLIIEFMDIGRLNNEDHARQIIEMYNNKSYNTNFDLLITVGPGINALLLKYGQNILKTSPVLNLDLDIPGRITLQDLHVKNGIEILAKFKVSSTLKTAFSLFPDNKNIFVIGGSSKVDSFFMSLVEKSKTQFEPAYNFKFISGISMDSTIRLAKKIPSNSIIIVPNYLTDIKNMTFSTPEALKFISNIAVAPVFTISDVFSKKEGGIGGYVFSYIFYGKETGRIANEMLEGKLPKDITVDENSLYQSIYDWQQLKRWNLVGSKAIPANSIYYNKEVNFFADYLWYFVGFMCFLVFQTLLIVYLIRLNRRQKEIKKRSVETERLYRKLVREDRLAKMSELTASLSHELNQPLTAILYSAQAGIRFQEAGKLNDKQLAEIFENIVEDAKRAGGLISSVKSLMKLETREKEKVNLVAIIEETVDIFHSEAIQNHIQIRLKLQDKPIHVLGDKIQLQQVLLNFIANAAIAMQNNDPANKIIEISQLLNKGFIKISVRDFGPGIDGKLKDVLFKPFVTSHKSGFGIGLAVSRSIIERHDGEIFAENIDGDGAEFSFRLKLLKNE